MPKNLKKKENVYWAFEKARCYVMKLRLKTTKDWARYCVGDLPGRNKKPKEIPTAPHEVYKEMGWRSWTHWFGSNRMTNFFKIKSHVTSVEDA